MIRIDARSSTPIYEQIVEGYKEHILRGHLKAGDAIPSVRKLALEMGVNPNTVSRAYQELERQKIIESMRGRGTYVSENLRLTATDEGLAKLRGKLRRLVVEMRYAGLGSEQMQQELAKAYQSLKEGDGDEN